MKRTTELDITNMSKTEPLSIETAIKLASALNAVNNLV
jgi:hypothetical protein